jgi:hypothetical protein
MPGNDSTAAASRNPKANGLGRRPTGVTPIASTLICLTPESGNRIHFNRPVAQAKGKQTGSFNKKTLFPGISKPF